MNQPWSYYDSDWFPGLNLAATNSVKCIQPFDQPKDIAYICNTKALIYEETVYHICRPDTVSCSSTGMNPARLDAREKVCGVQLETIEDPMMRDLRILDKLVDELAKGLTIEKITSKRD